jgi:hypothetical protein
MVSGRAILILLELKLSQVALWFAVFGLDALEVLPGSLEKFVG